MTPLRKRMIEDMQLRNLAPQTQRSYLHHIAGLARFFQISPEHLNLEDIRQYQVYLANHCRYSADSVNQFLSAAKLLYGVTLEAPFDTGCLLRARIPKNARIILSQQEVARFFDHVPSIRYRAALMGKWPVSSTTSPVFATAPRSWWLTAPACASPRWWPSRLRTSTRNACCSASKRARVSAIVTPCCLRACGKSCVPGSAPRLPPIGGFPAGASTAT